MAVTSARNPEPSGNSTVVDQPGPSPTEPSADDTGGAHGCHTKTAATTAATTANATNTKPGFHRIPISASGFHVYHPGSVIGHHRPSITPRSAAPLPSEKHRVRRRRGHRGDQHPLRQHRTLPFRRHVWFSQVRPDHHRHTSWILPLAAATFPTDGNYTLTVRATDTIGNASNSSTNHVIDHKKPQLPGQRRPTPRRSSIVYQTRVAPRHQSP